ncbi:MAG: hypothetical protein GF416_07325 [Candidatus Altiarchaeales archaeon]|nr:hypothetical protein [Candidatus Altiarchaeales archaeon]MBD3416923.1 hypothetical protein [Candidatus Altiarchaeales archaeon]
MPYVDLNMVLDEAGEADFLHVMRVLVRSSLFHAAGNRPELLILTDKVLYHGGTSATNGRFNRVPFVSVLEASKAGRYIWECLRLRHMETAGENTVYLCPFTGSPASPARDADGMDVLFNQLKKGCE